MQRVRLAAQLGSGLTGVLYVLDEPTIGLHPRDTGRLLASLRALVDRGNSVLVVEHDADTIRAADHVVDVGPGGGARAAASSPRARRRRCSTNRRSVTGRGAGASARACPIDGAALEALRGSRSSARASTTSRTSTCGSRSVTSSR